MLVGMWSRLCCPAGSFDHMCRRSICKRVSLFSKELSNFLSHEFRALAWQVYIFGKCNLSSSNFSLHISLIVSWIIFLIVFWICFWIVFCCIHAYMKLFWIILWIIFWILDLGSDTLSTKDFLDVWLIMTPFLWTLQAFHICLSTSSGVHHHKGRRDWGCLSKMFDGHRNLPQVCWNWAHGTRRWFLKNKIHHPFRQAF